VFDVIGVVGWFGDVYVGNEHEGTRTIGVRAVVRGGL